MKQLIDAAMEGKLSAPWSAVGNEVVKAIGDLLGVRLVGRDGVRLTGTWREFKASLPENMVGLEAQLQGDSAGRLGLLWVVEDAGAPIAWTEQESICLEIGRVVAAGVAGSLSVATGQKLDLIPTTEPAEAATLDTFALEPDTAGVMITWEATGDDVTCVLALVAEVGLLQQWAEQAAQGARTHSQSRHGADRESGKVPTRAPHLPQWRQTNAAQQRDLAFIMDLPLRLTVEIGSARMLIKDVLTLGKDAVVELDRLAGDLVDIRVNDKLLARGEVVVLPDGKFGVRVMEIINSKERLQNLQMAK